MEQQTRTWRVLPEAPLETLDAYVEAGGGDGLRAAARLSAAEIVDEVEASGLRGRGGAGFPTGVKLRTVAANCSPAEPTTVVVNGAEGEPGSFKDRAILRSNPYAVLEGALIAAHALGADQVIVALKRTSTTEAARVDAAISELETAGWGKGAELSVFLGPTEYLYGEETALLEAIDGRSPFPRIAPPFRRGVDELVDSAADVATESSSAAHVELAGPGADSVAAPTLASNVETYANLPGILANGADWFRTVGTPESPGTIVCTVSGRTRRAGVGEVAMGTPLREIIETIGGGPIDGRRVHAVMSGVANAVIPESLLDTPASHEAMTAIGSGLGAAGFIVFDDTTDLVAVAAGVARFLAVESCGQCTPCKRDGLVLSGALARLAQSEREERDLEDIDEALATIAEGARCNLAVQQQVVVGSVLDLFPDEIEAHADSHAGAVQPEPIASIAALDGTDAVLDVDELTKQPDWTHDPVDSGQWPASRLDEHRAASESR
jgi:NADH-quinone oxidoreductase subunit F